MDVIIHAAQVTVGVWLGVVVIALGMFGLFVIVAVIGEALRNASR